MAITLTVNGVQHPVEVTPGTPLLWVLRDHLGLTGTKFGCGVAQCGACTVHVNGLPRRACVTPIEAVANGEVTTIEGVAGPEADAIRTPGKRSTCHSAAIVNRVRSCRRSRCSKPSRPQATTISIWR